MGGRKLERQIEQVIAYIFGGLEERITNIAGVLGTTSEILATSLGGLLLKMGSGSPNTVSSMLRVPAGAPEVREPTVAMARGARGKPQRTRKSAKTKTLVECPKCPAKVRNLGTHDYMKHKGGARRLAKHHWARRK